jgi:hypothetical protein
MVSIMMNRDLARFPWEELGAEDVRFLFRVIDKYVVCVSEWGEEVSAAALACFGKAPDILGVNRLV